MNIGVLAVQGAVEEHIKSVSQLNESVIPVKLPHHLDNIDALIIPGGESTTISKLLADYSLLSPLKEMISKGFPVFGTCAGMILLAKTIIDSDVENLAAIDIGVHRNAYGRQIDSFETDLTVSCLGEKSFRGIFIRAPVIEFVEPNVEVLCKLNGRAVAVRQGNILACAFHPELTDDLRFHQYFVNLIKGETFAKSNN